jgi:hypothetical protein
MSIDVNTVYAKLPISALPSLANHKSMNKAPNTSKQYLLARQTVFRRHCKQTYSCQIGRRQTAYIPDESKNYA